MRGKNFYKVLGLNPSNGLPYKVMLVEGMKMTRMILKQILLSERFEVILEAENGQDAINLINNAAVKPDIYLSGIEMERMNGIDAIKVIHPHHPNMKIIMITNIQNEDRVKEAIQSGVTGYIVKPYKNNLAGGESFERKEFLSRLAHILDRDDYPTRYA